MPASIDLHTLPYNGRQILYAPLSQTVAILSSSAVEQLRWTLEGKSAGASHDVRQLASRLSSPIREQEPVRSGDLRDPLFLGLIPTRGCNMGCRYCDFAAPKSGQRVMDLGTARDCVDAYFNLIQNTDLQVAEIQFFGGEPFFGNSIAEFVLPYARMLAHHRGIEARFTVTTNGFCTQRQAQWIAENFDSVVLSLDGHAAAQNAQRPTAGGGVSFDVVQRTADILSAGCDDLIVRACVTRSTVDQLPDFAEWISRTLTCSAVCFEALTCSDLSEQNQLLPPDPISFAQAVLKAGEILEGYGIQTMTSGTDLNTLQESFCPVGKDAIIVTPDGQVNACYLLEEDWLAEGHDLHYGRLARETGFPHFEIDPRALDSIRRLARQKGVLCEDCFARYHCAGGCHVNHFSARMTGAYDDVCIQTRAITAGRLLKQVCSPNAYRVWVDDRDQITATLTGARRLAEI